MFKLKKLNVVKVVDSEYKKNKLIAEGFKLVKDKLETTETKKPETNKGAKKNESNVDEVKNLTGD